MRSLQINTEKTPAQILSSAVVRAAGYWDINNKNLAKICGLSESSVSRLKNGLYELEEHSKEGELSILFLRIFRGLDAYLGGHEENQKAWLYSYNKALGGVPAELMQTVEGLAAVLRYVDYIRG
jgi:hypothetical protein